MIIKAGHVWVSAKPILGTAPALIRDFKTIFGVSPETVAAIWNITPFDDDITLVNLLWALSFLTVYDKEAVLIRMTGAPVSRQTYRKKIWSVLQSMTLKSRDIVSFLVSFVVLSQWLPVSNYVLFRFDGRIGLRNLEARPV